MRGHVKTKDVFLAKIGTQRRGLSQSAFKFAFVTPVITDENEAIRLSVDGWFKYVTKPGFVADQNRLTADAQNYVFDVQTFENEWPTKKEQLKLKRLKRLEQKLNNER